MIEEHCGKMLLETGMEVDKDLRVMVTTDGKWSKIGVCGVTLYGYTK